MWQKMAEGVVSAPLLPSGDKGRKDGFAPFCDESLATFTTYCKTAHKGWTHPKNNGCATGCGFQNPPELGEWPDHTTKTVLAHSPSVSATSRKGGFATPSRVL